MEATDSGFMEVLTEHTLRGGKNCSIIILIKKYFGRYCAMDLFSSFPPEKWIRTPSTQNLSLEFLKMIPRWHNLAF